MDPAATSSCELRVMPGTNPLCFDSGYYSWESVNLRSIELVGLAAGADWRTGFYERLHTSHFAYRPHASPSDTSRRKGSS